MLKCLDRWSFRHLATHRPRWKAEVLVNRVADRLEEKSFEALGNKLA